MHVIIDTNTLVFPDSTRLYSIVTRPLDPFLTGTLTRIWILSSANPLIMLESFWSGLPKFFLGGVCFVFVWGKGGKCFMRHNPMRLHVWDSGAGRHWVDFPVWRLDPPVLPTKTPYADATRPHPIRGGGPVLGSKLIDQVSIGPEGL